VSVANDGGRWSFFTKGEPLEEEDLGSLSAVSVRDRFSADHLRALVERMVPLFWETDAWPKDDAVLVERLGNLPAAFADVDLTDAQRMVPRAPVRS